MIFFFLILDLILKKKIDTFLNEYYNDYIIFINSNDLNNILVEDKDNYYKSFFIKDYKTRNIKNINEYIDFIKNSVSNFNNNQKDKIKKCIYKANLKILKINLEWFNGNKAIKIPWKIGCIKEKLYEYGLPHTRNDIIIISSNDIDNFSENKLIKTLIHEKVHIYQKKYYIEVLKYLKMNGFKKIKKRDENDNIRANPDLDDWIYEDKNHIYKAIYNKNPSNITDITYYPINKQSYEHPFEKMAIDIENLINF